MMEYDINKEYLDGLRLRLERCINHKKSYGINEMIYKDCSTIDMMIDNYFLKRDISLKDDFIEEKILYDAAIMKEYKNDFIYLSSYRDANDDFCKVDLCEESKKRFSNDEVIFYVKEFFKGKGYLEDRTNQFFLQGENHLKFFDKSNNGSMGETYVVNSMGESFLFIPNSKDVDAIITTIHELTHASAYYQNPSHYLLKEKRIFRETDSLLMEIIACDYFNKEVNLIGPDIRKKNLLASIHNCAKCAIEKKNIIDLLAKRKDKNFVDSLKYLESRNSEYSLDFLYYLFEEDFDEQFYYAISYLVAIEFYYLYNDDKEKSMYLLKKFVDLGKGIDYYSCLENMGINIGEHTKSYYLSLKKNS